MKLNTCLTFSMVIRIFITFFLAVHLVTKNDVQHVCYKQFRDIYSCTVKISGPQADITRSIPWKETATLQENQTLYSTLTTSIKVFLRFCIMFIPSFNVKSKLGCCKSYVYDNNTIYELHKSNGIHLNKVLIINYTPYLYFVGHVAVTC